MEINLGNERIVQLQATYSAEQIQERALAKRVDVFGQMAKLFQRPKPEDIEIAIVQKRFEPFWFAAATARYAYDRRHTYRVAVSPEVQAVTLYGKEHAVAQERNRAFEMEAVERCVEELRLESTLDAVRGNEVDMRKYLEYPKNEVQEIAELEKDGALVVPPEIRSSFVVRKLAAALMKTFHADRIHEERIDVQEITLFYRPLYAAEFYWKAKNKKQVVELDALTGEMKAEGSEIKKRVTRVLENDALFDIGADTVGMVVPGANIAIKLGRHAVRKAVR
ncbi:MAG: hypothetical protein M1343_13850 [Chloroflexi bacterium]|nr:hypothetical protein [Chloroflexota bacterium]MDA8186921.1 hypothetical protein [Dehalococcoidales bacterium]